MSNSDNTAKVDNEETIKCRPFLKWVGGKNQLLPELIARIPSDFNKYFEPFIGGGALFFYLQPYNSFISDINKDLINAYQVVQQSPEALISELQEYIYEKEYYSNVRKIDRLPDFKKLSALKKAARLIYLNKTGFNGLYRVNSKGYYNVPFGRYTNPKICDAVNLRACHLVLQRADIQELGFEIAVAKATAGDFVYFDPPYVPLNETSNFTAYASSGFGKDQQIRLRDTCVDLDKRGVKFMLSNSCTELVQELYQNFSIEEVMAVRNVNSNASARGEVTELLVRNYS